MATLQKIYKVTKEQYESIVAGTFDGHTYDENALYLVEDDGSDVDVPTKTSELENDSGFIEGNDTEYTPEVGLSMDNKTIVFNTDFDFSIFDGLSIGKRNLLTFKRERYQNNELIEEKIELSFYKYTWDKHLEITENFKNNLSHITWYDGKWNRNEYSFSTLISNGFYIDYIDDYTNINEIIKIIEKNPNDVSNMPHFIDKINSIILPLDVDDPVLLVKLAYLYCVSNNKTDMTMWFSNQGTIDRYEDIVLKIYTSSYDLGASITLYNYSMGKKIELYMNSYEFPEDIWFGDECANIINSVPAIDIRQYGIDLTNIESILNYLWENEAEGEFYIADLRPNPDDEWYNKTKLLINYGSNQDEGILYANVNSMYGNEVYKGILDEDGNLTWQKQTTISDLESQIESKADTDHEHDNYATTKYVDDQIAAAVTGGEIDLSGYATKEELNGKADSDHNHDNDYAEKDHNHDDKYLPITEDVKVSDGQVLFDKIYARTSSSGTEYGMGTSSQVLKSNGTNVYWGADANATSTLSVSSIFKAKNPYGGYQILFTDRDNLLVPAVSGSGTNTGTSKVMNTEPFNPFGPIFYTSSASNRVVDQACSNSTHMVYADVNVSYSFNCGSTLTAHKPFYIVAKIQEDGMAVLHSPYYSQTLPTSEDGLIYIYLGQASGTNLVYLYQEHPIYVYKNGKICQFLESEDIDLSDYATKEELNELNTDIHGSFTEHEMTPGLLLNGKTLLFDTSVPLPYRGVEEKIIWLAPSDNVGHGVVFDAYADMYFVRIYQFYGSPAFPLATLCENGQWSQTKYVYNDSSDRYLGSVSSDASTYFKIGDKTDGITDRVDATLKNKLSVIDLGATNIDDALAKIISDYQSQSGFYVSNDDSLDNDGKILINYVCDGPSYSYAMIYAGDNILKKNWNDRDGWESVCDLYGTSGQVEQSFKSASISGNTLTFTKNNNQTQSVTLPSGGSASFAFIQLFQSTLTYGGNVNFNMNNYSSTYKEFKIVIKPIAVPDDPEDTIYIKDTNTSAEIALYKATYSLNDATMFDIIWSNQTGWVITTNYPDVAYNRNTIISTNGVLQISNYSESAEYRIHVLGR